VAEAEGRMGLDPLFLPEYYKFK